jgi:hypothetical protein
MKCQKEADGNDGRQVLNSMKTHGYDLGTTTAYD